MGLFLKKKKKSDLLTAGVTAYLANWGEVAFALDGHLQAVSCRSSQEILQLVTLAVSTFLTSLAYGCYLHYRKAPPKSSKYTLAKVRLSSSESHKKRWKVKEEMQRGKTAFLHSRLEGTGKTCPQRSVMEGNRVHPPVSHLQLKLRCLKCSRKKKLMEECWGDSVHRQTQYRWNHT